MRKTKKTSWLLISAMLIASIAATLVVFEFGLRLVYHPVDYLLPTTENDAYLNHRIAGGSGGHDDWGFRNYTRPEQAQIVAIGDSNTYGIAAHFYESWPAVLSNLTGKTTYNMGLGGYGPLHYLYLLRERAVRLKPDTVVVAIYFGNDFMDVINLAYSNANWMNYRNPELQKTVDAGGLIVGGIDEYNKGVIRRLRDYLAKTSILYRMLTESPLFDRFRRVNEGSVDPAIYVFAEQDFTTILTPGRHFQLVNTNDPQIRTAIDITKSTIIEMNTVSVEGKFDLMFLLLPTKELVYSNVLAKRGKINAHPDMEAAIKQEKLISKELIDFFKKHSIRYVFPLDALQLAAETKTIYPFNDGHPNSVGYRIIAKKVAEALNQQAHN